MGKKKISNDEILQVALQLIDENGIDNLQMKDIAARLKIKSASLYKHFENYDDVVINLYILCLTDFRKYIEDRIEGSESEEGIRKMSYAFLDYLEKYSNRYEVVLKSKHFMHPLVREEDNKLIGNLLHFLDSYCRNREDIINASRIYRSMIAGFAFYESKGLFSLPMVTTRKTFDILIDNYISYLKSIKTDSHLV